MACGQTAPKLPRRRKRARSAHTVSGRKSRRPVRPLFRRVWMYLAAWRLRGIIAMTRLCMIGFFAVLASGQAWPAALDGNNDRAVCDQGDLAACTRIINDVVADAQDRVAAGITRG